MDLLFYTNMNLLIEMKPVSVSSAKGSVIIYDMMTEGAESNYLSDRYERAESSSHPALHHTGKKSDAHSVR